MFRRLRWVFLLAAAAWVAAWLAVSRYAMMDDTLIHLNYADYLHNLHFITYDGIHHTYGTSSLLYVTLLALLRGIFTGPLLAKGVSIVAFVIMLCFLVLLAERHSNTERRLVLYAIVLATLTPSGIKWLTDGMETSLTAFAVIAMAVLLARSLSGKLSGREAAIYFIATALLTFLRLELALVAAVSAAALLLRRRNAGIPFSRAIATPLAALAGVVFALLVILRVFGHILPDTAIAKRLMGHAVQLWLSAHAIAAAMGFGIGLLIVWIWTAATWARRLRPSEISLWLLVNCPFVVIVGLAVVRGQRIESIRYLFWTMLFSAVAGALIMQPAPQAALKTQRRAFAFVVLVLLCLLPVDAHATWVILRARDLTIRKMAAQPLRQLFQDKTVVAADVGAIGYFTKAHVCDVAGLVDGRDFSKWHTPDRYRYCIANKPDALYFNSIQLSDVEVEDDPLTDWRVCATYDFNIVHWNNRHYLVVPAAQAEKVCSSLGNSPQPVPVLTR